MNYINELDSINQEINNLAGRRAEIARAAFKEAAQAIFANNPEVENFVFGISGREYNDEGLYEGVNHVAINVDKNDIEDQYWQAYRSSWGTKQETLEDQIKDVLRAIGSDALVSALGDYDIVHIDQELNVTKIQPYL